MPSVVVNVITALYPLNESPSGGVITSTDTLSIVNDNKYPLIDVIAVIHSSNVNSLLTAPSTYVLQNVVISYVSSISFV